METSQYRGVIVLTWPGLNRASVAGLCHLVNGRRKLFDRESMKIYDTTTTLTTVWTCTIRIGYTGIKVVW